MLNKKNEKESFILENELFTKQYHFITDKVMSKINKEFVTFTAINRLLLGWNKTEDFITFKQLETLTGLAVNTISKHLTNLEAYNIIKITKTFYRGYERMMIALNLNYTTYILPEKQKLTSKVANFLKSSGPKKEVFKLKKVTVTNSVNNTPSQKLRQEENKVTISNFEIAPYQKLRRATISKIETSKDTNINKNLNTYHDHKKETQKMNNDNEFKNFDNNKNQNTKSKKDNVTFTTEQLELKVILEDEFKFYSSVAEKALNDYSVEFLKTQIDFVYDQMAVKEIKNAGAFLSKILKNPEKPKYNQEQSPGPEEKPMVKTSPTKELETKIIEFFYNENLIQSKGTNTALDEAMDALLSFKDNQVVMNNFRALGIQKEQIEAVFKSKAFYPVGYVQKIKTFLDGYTLTLQEVKQDTSLRAVGLSFFRGVKTKVENIVTEIKTTYDVFGNDENEVIPC